MKKRVCIAVSLLLCVSPGVFAQKSSIYHKGWIDFNKNGVMDVYEDPSQPIDKRVDDLLSQMTLEEKSCQLATLYGYGRVLKDSLPMPSWKNEIWKDGIANIDEQLNGVGRGAAKARHLIVPFSSHVKALYERLDSQLARLSEALSSSGKGDNPMAKSVADLRSNLDFMNQINQMYSYVQLPLKMSEGKAHGDLYVYANKKSLASKDGSISALLHLDMEHLGPVDVYVAMQEQRVTTHFYLPDEAMLDFIEAHIHILNEKIKKKGYALNPVLSVKNEEKTAVEEMLGTGEEVSVLSQYSFDVRA